MAYSWAVDPGFNQAAQQIDNAWAQADRNRQTEFENRQRMSDPSYWAQAFGFGGGSSNTAYSSTPRANPYEARLNSLLSNPDSIANTGAYKFALDQGTEAVNRNLAAKGLLKSGNRLSELTKFGQGLASQQYGAEVDRLSRLYGIGEQSNLTRERNAIDAQSADNQMRLGMMRSMMDWNKRYQQPGEFQTPSGTMLRWD